MEATQRYLGQTVPAGESVETPHVDASEWLYATAGCYASQNGTVQFRGYVLSRPADPSSDLVWVVEHSYAITAGQRVGASCRTVGAQFWSVRYTNDSGVDATVNLVFRTSNTGGG